MRAEAESLDFLGRCNRLNIPFFQRRYVWVEKNWIELLNSFKNKEVVPFLGSLILKEERGNNYSVIDGQQRLTTITLLAKAIFDILPEAHKGVDSGVRNCAQSYLFYRRNQIDSFKMADIKIDHSKNDRKDYERVLRAGLQDEETIDTDTINSETASNVLLCYKFYVELLKNEPLESLLSIYSSIFDRERRIFVLIYLEHGDINEQSIFDTINRAGEKLTVSDIIKNNLYKHLLTKAGADPAREIEVHKCYEDCWEDIFNKDQDCYDLWEVKRTFGNVKHTNLEFLLYCIACIKWGKDEDMFPNLASVYEKEISQMEYTDLLFLANEIREYAYIYKKYILDLKAALDDEGQSVYFKYDEHVKRLLLIMQKFKIQMFYPYVLMRLHNIDRSKADTILKDEFNKLESFIVRRKISPRGTHDYTSKCYHIIQNGIDSLRHSDFENPDGKISNYEIKKYLSNIKDDPAKMILFCIELYRRRSASIDVRALEYSYTLEHIMPKEWTSEWSDIEIVNDGIVMDPATIEAKQFRQAAIESLGNKTLLTGKLNSTLRNGSFVKKLNGDGADNPGYENHTSLLVTREIVNAAKNDPVWDEAHIGARLDKLYDEFLLLWPQYSSEDPDLSQFTTEQLDNPIALLSAISCTVSESTTTVSPVEQHENDPSENITDSMVSLEELTAMVSAQPETIERYVREGKIVADAIIQTSEHRDCKYFKLDTINSYVEQFGWIVIDDTNRKQLFIEMIQQMDMSYSYKPVFIKALLKHADSEGVIKLNHVVSYFLNYYKKRRNAGVLVEKENSVFSNPNCSEEDAQKVILKYPYDRFRTMQVLTLEADGTELRFNKNLWGQLTPEEKAEIEDICDQKLIAYFARL